MKNLKVVLTGGPCAGKTTAIEEIEKEFTEKGYNVYVVPEAATILINSGIRPFGNTPLTLEEFQEYVISLQLKLESLANKAATSTDKPSIIICDRGLLDGQAYVKNEKIYRGLLNDKGKKAIDVLNNYDLVLHLTTAAASKKDIYTLENNQARTETKEEAIIKDKKTLAAWIGHDNLKVIGNKDSFKEKIDNVIYEIYNALGKPYPIQKQHKYIVKDIDFNKLNEKDIVKLNINQAIIKDDNKDIMYRKIIKDNEESDKKIIKIDTNNNGEREVIKRQITKEEYYENIKGHEIIKKDRFCFIYKEQYFRLDIFEEGLQLLEIEETNKTKEIEIPEFIKVEREVTSDINYRNSNIAKKNEIYKLKNIKEIILKEQLDEIVNDSLKVNNDFEKAYDDAINCKKKIKKYD